MAEKQSGGDFSYLASIFPCSQADTWMDITLSSTVVSHELRYLQPSEDNWRVLRLKVCCTSMCSNTAFYTGLINLSMLLILLPQSSAPYVANWIFTVVSWWKKHSNNNYQFIYFFFQICGYNGWRLEWVTLGGNLDLKSPVSECPRNFSFRAAKSECFECFVSELLEQF